MPADWSKLKYFKKENTNDNWGDPDKLDETLLFALDDFRKFVGHPVHVTSGTGGVHSKTSMHYVGKAVDIVIPEYKNHTLDLIFAAMRFPFTGIGFYPHWWYKNKNNVIGGLHLDMRPVKQESDFTPDFRMARWIGVKQSVYAQDKLISRQDYRPMTYGTLKQLLIIK